MKKSEVYTLFAYIKRFYPNFSGDDETVIAWHELLTDVLFTTALDNLKRYATKSPKWAPSIADLRTDKDPITAYQDHLRKDANQFIGDLDKFRHTAAPPSESVKERMRQLAERNAARRDQH